MKKIIIVASGLVLSIAGYSQNAATNGGGKAAVSSGVVDPTINGKPYSQYKAEQDALKMKNAVVSKQAGPAVDVKYNTAPPSQNSPAKPKGSEMGNPVAPVVTEAAVVKAETKTVQAPVLNDIIAQKSVGTGNTIDGKPAAVPSSPRPAGVEGGANTVVPSATVKIAPAAAVSGSAPVAPTVMPDAAQNSGSNSNGGTAEKPAAAPAPKTKSDQAPDAPVQETKTRQGL